MAAPGKLPLITSAIRRAVVKSGLRSVRRRTLRLASWKLTSRSTLAPPAMRPAVGTPFRTAEPEAPPALIEPVCTVPCATA
jgi:hypothetical protein